MYLMKNIINVHLILPHFNHCHAGVKIKNTIIMKKQKENNKKRLMDHERLVPV